MRWLPRSLLGRTLLALVVGLAVSHLASLAFFAVDRSRAVGEAGGRQLAERIAILAQMAREAPEAIAGGRGLRGGGLRAMIGSETPPGAPGTTDWVTSLLERLLLEQLSGATVDQVRVRRVLFAEAMPAFVNDSGFGPRSMMGGMGPGGHHGPWSHFHRDPSEQVLLVSMRLQEDGAEEGQWLHVLAPFAMGTPFWSGGFFLPSLLVTMAALLAAMWAVRRAVGPLDLFTRAAERLGRDVDAPPLPEEGVIEVRRAARAFNDMQGRLRELVHGRTRMLAAISHDLRTPITRLRLRAELIDDGETRSRMLADLAEMATMIAATLSFARDESAREDRTSLDLAALLQSLCDDAQDAGHEVSYDGVERLSFPGRPLALKRAFGNLIDNAIKYGVRARVTLCRHEAMVEVTVEDSGPGIPETELDKVFLPFHRVEGSRNRESGGVGLGLAVVAAAVRAHGGTVTLANRVAPDRGLRATVMLPPPPAEATAPRPDRCRESERCG